LLANAATVDITAFAIALFFGVLSFSAMPRERQKVKQELATTFRDLQTNYTESLRQTLAAELNKCLQQFTDVIKPKQELLEKQIATSKSIEERVKASRAEINEILTAINN
jgi:ABC-type transporter Mla subunit MlaD